MGLVDVVEVVEVVVVLGGAKVIPAPSAGSAFAVVVVVAFVGVVVVVVVVPIPPVHSTRTLLITPEGLVLTLGLHLPGVPILVLQTMFPVFRMPECCISAVGSLHLTLQTFG